MIGAALETPEYSTRYVTVFFGRIGRIEVDLIVRPPRDRSPACRYPILLDTMTSRIHSIRLVVLPPPPPKPVGRRVLS